MFAQIWNTELRNNPHLFKTQVISTHDTRQSALAKEAALQQKLNVVKSSMYVNQAIAQVYGYAGRDVSGTNNPMYRKGHKIKGRMNGRYGDGRTTYRDKSGRTVCTTPSDPRVLSGELVGNGTNGELISLTKLLKKFPDARANTQNEMYRYIHNLFMSSKMKRTEFCRQHSLDYTTFLKVFDVFK
jgi:hypothetical protein